MEDELRAIHKNDMWNVVVLPLGYKAIATKWIYTVKTQSDGTFAKLKARLVA